MTANTVAMIIILLYNVEICQSIRYDNYTLFTTTPSTSEQMTFLKDLMQRNYLHVIFWKKPNKLYEDVHFIISPEDKGIFLEKAHLSELKMHVQQENVQR